MLILKGISSYLRREPLVEFQEMCWFIWKYHIISDLRAEKQSLDI